MSIGDVLSLLRAEFADITISKIRFLESQGLVNPERSPSGYRKFYDDDVERLRWVLRQQRENFLPLKVIRDRLDGGSQVPSSVAVKENEGIRDSREKVVRSQPVRHQKVGLVSSSPVAAGIGDPGHTVRLSGISNEVVDSRDERVASQGVQARALAPDAKGAARAELETDDLPYSRIVAPERGEPAASGEQPSNSHDSHAEEFVRSPGQSGASLNIDELSASSQLSQTEVAALEGYGLLEPTVIGGSPYYDEESLTIARVVKDFGRYGIEPRHLRLYCNFVARETSLVEQVIAPLLRQRNPEARHRAGEAAVDIARLGQALRGSLMRREIRRELGG